MHKKAIFIIEGCVMKKVDDKHTFVRH